MMRVALASLFADIKDVVALHKRKVFELADLPKGRKAIKNRWVFTTKSDGHKKARLVAKGFSQIEGIDFDHIFSLVVRYESVHLLLAVTALENWHIEGLDVKSVKTHSNHKGSRRLTRRNTGKGKGSLY